MIQKKRELHLSYSQAFGVARKTDKFRPRYSAGVHLISVLHLLIAKFREYSEYRKRFVFLYVICLKFILSVSYYSILFVQLMLQGSSRLGQPFPFRGQRYKK